jgi:uncharacterized protein YciI
MAQIALRFADKPLDTLAAGVREAHRQFLKRHRGALVTFGPIAHPDGRPAGYAYQLDLPGFDPASLKPFLAEDPLEEARHFTSTLTWGWRCALPHRQATMPLRPGLQGFFFHGIGKPNMTEKRNQIVQPHIAHLGRVDASNCVARGPLTNLAGETWEGSGMVYEFENRAALDRFFQDEPYCVNGLYERIDLYGWQRGEMAT